MATTVTAKNKGFKYVDKSSGKLNVQKVIQGGQFVAKENLERSQSSGGSAGNQPSASQSEVKYYKADGLTPVYGAVGESTVVPAGASPAPYSNVNLSKATIDVGSGSSINDQLKAYSQRVGEYIGKDLTRRVDEQRNKFNVLSGSVGAGSTSVARYEANLSADRLYAEKRQVLLPTSTPYGVLYKGQVASAQASAERSALLESDAQMRRNLGPLYPAYPAYKTAESKASGVVGGIKLFGSPLKESLPKISQGLEPQISSSASGVLSSNNLTSKASSAGKFLFYSTQKELVDNIYAPAVSNPILFGASTYGVSKFSKVFPKITTTAVVSSVGMQVYNEPTYASKVSKVVGIGGSLGIVYGVSNIRPKVRDLNIPTSESTTNVKLYGYETSGGRSVILGSRINNKLSIGTPNIKSYLQDLNPSSEIKIGSAMETKTIQKNIVGIESTTRAKELIPLSQNILRSTKNTKSRFSQEFPKETERLPSKGVDVMLKLGKEERGVLFGSYSRSADLAKEYNIGGKSYSLNKTPRDIEFRFDTATESDLGRITTKGVKYLNDAGIPSREIFDKGQRSYAIESLQGSGEYAKVAEFKGKKQIIDGEEVPEFVVGIRKTSKPVSLYGIQKTSLSEELRGVTQGVMRVRKKDNVIDIYPSPKREKDVGSVVVSSRTLAQSKVFRSKRLDSSIERFESLFPESLTKQQLTSKKSVIANYSVNSKSSNVSSSYSSYLSRVGVNNTLSSSVSSGSSSKSSSVSSSRSSISSSRSLSLSSSNSFSKSYTTPSSSASLSVNYPSNTRSVSSSVSKTFSGSKSFSGSPNRSISSSITYSPSSSITYSPGSSIIGGNNIIDPPPDRIINKFPKFNSYTKSNKNFNFKSIAQSRSYSPSAFSASLNIRGKSSRAGVSTGLGIRPIMSKRRK